MTVRRRALSCRKTVAIAISWIYDQKQNGGIHAARVRGLSLCTGDYVIFLDQDDRLREDAVATFIATMKKYQTEADKVHATLGQEFSRTKIAQIMRYPVLVSNALMEQKDGEVLMVSHGLP